MSNRVEYPASTPATGRAAPETGLTDAGIRLMFTEARTANSFRPGPLAEDVQQALWELARWPPTAGNTNPLRVLYVASAEARARLVPHLDEGNRVKTASAPLVAVLCRDDDYHEFMPRLLPYKPGMRDALAGNDALREQTGQLNAHLQAAYFIMAVRALGLCAGPMAGFDVAGVTAEFFADDSWCPFLVVNIGYPGPDAWLGRLPRLEFDDAVRRA